MVLALRLDREVDHHDCVLLHDADQHDDAHEGIHVQFDPESHQRHQRTQAGGGQARQDRERMDEAFVEDAEHEVDHEHREQQQDAHTLQGALEGLRRAAEGGVDRGGNLHRRHCLVDLLDGLGQGHAGAHVEGERDRRQLPEVGDRERADVVGELRQRVERHQRAGVRPHVQQAEGRRVRLVAGLQFQDDPVLVGRRVDRRYLR